MGLKYAVLAAVVVAICSALPPCTFAGVTERVSVSSSGQQGNGDSYASSISADGQYVAFMSGASNLVTGDTNWNNDIFVHDRQTGETTRVSLSSTGEQGNNDSRFSSISADGRFVTFLSNSSNMVPGDTNGCCDIFVHDRQTGQTARVSVSSSGEQGNSGSCLIPSISADGRFVTLADPNDKHNTTIFSKKETRK